MPDGVYKVYEANNHGLHYTFRVNDHHMWQYHRNNGISKMGIHSEVTKKGKSHYINIEILRIHEGVMET
jgi:hypothetical protein